MQMKLITGGKNEIGRQAQSNPVIFKRIGQQALTLDIFVFF